MRDLSEVGKNTVGLRGAQVNFGFSPAPCIPVSDILTRSTGQVIDHFAHYLTVKLGSGMRLPMGGRLQVTAATIGLDFEQHRRRPTADVLSARLPANATIELILELVRYSARHHLEEALRCLRDPESRHTRTNAARALACFIREISLRTASIDAASSKII